jgi:hypothetical protein
MSKKKNRKQTVCLCGRPSIRYRNGWVCERCNRIEDINAAAEKQRIQKPGCPYTWKYFDTFSCNVKGVL